MKKSKCVQIGSKPGALHHGLRVGFRPDGYCEKRMDGKINERPL
jgi:hypothetical protein